MQSPHTPSSVVSRRSASLHPSFQSFHSCLQSLVAALLSLAAVCLLLSLSPPISRTDGCRFPSHPLSTVTLSLVSRERRWLNNKIKHKLSHQFDNLSPFHLTSVTGTNTDRPYSTWLRKIHFLQMIFLYINNLFYIIWWKYLARLTACKSGHTLRNKKN